jgi:8-oxo-dGTP pyrophosphatase MutT (NUDIX family)
MSDMHVVQKVVLAGIIMRDGKVLVLKRSEDEEVMPGLWELPSGKKETLEGWRDALIREVREETGLDTEPVAPVDIYDYVIEKPDETRDTTQINFLMRIVGDSDVRLSGEHDDHAWVTETELDIHKTSDKTRNAILAAFKFGK